MKKIRKAVIPAAGYGTGFLPVTKAIAKEMLPIVDKPVIQFIVEEAVASGIEEILIITGKSKRPIEDHFDSNIELEENLESKGKVKMLEMVQSITQANLFFVRQSYPLGLGDAIYQAKAFVGDEPFVVMLGDNIMDSETPVTKQIMDLYHETGAPNVALVEVEAKETRKYGIADVQTSSSHKLAEDVVHINHFVEKPQPEKAPSNLAIAGRYVLTPEIFDLLENLAPGLDDEVQLTDAIEQLNESKRVLGKVIEGKRYDVGNPMGYMQMSIEYALKHPETAEDFKQYLIRMSKELSE
ncbi:UTP--glucose-1-phosphate uridylyltransferase GalU [Vaginisenegalia massiliensis]|uniref:UTP--glucose-1-phosphate uridylyltransferase GalU n=1 Tax=Vaginisenegalia massiliensis TaxID=2058294 RepID=UPI000F54B54E|nr:UTP--glucose-1-phosphate uridylyltransferase GalU [Vaginisenegalia massiliensis]